MTRKRTNWREYVASPKKPLRPQRTMKFITGIDSSVQVTIYGRTNFDEDVLDMVIEHAGILQRRLRMKTVSETDHE